MKQIKLYYNPNDFKESNSNRYCPHCGGRIQVGAVHKCGSL